MLIADRVSRGALTPSARPGPVAQLLSDAIDQCSANATEVPADIPVDLTLAQAIRVLGSCVVTAMDGEHTARPPELPTHRNLQPLLDQIRRQFLKLASASPHLLAGREVLRVLNGFERVQRRIEADAAQRLAGQLSGADAMDLVVAVAHDMRSPLSSILFLVDAIRSGMSGPVTSQQEQQLLLVYSAAFGLSSLAGDMMSLARGGERLSQEPESPFSVRECMQSVRDIVQPIAAEKKLELVLRPPAAADRRLGRPMVLGRVLLNLATNALKFTDHGSVSVEAREAARQEVEFSVRDTGRGIPPEVVETMFNAFRRRAGTAGFVFSSAGLGLALCQKLVATMGSELKVETTIGHGTCFHFRVELPIAQRL